MRWKTLTRLEKRHRPGEEPYEVIEIEGNLGLNSGFNYLWTTILGATKNVFDNAAAILFVGNGTQAAATTQTALQGASFFGLAMATTHPYATAAKGYFKGVAASDQANFAWAEWAVGRGNATTQEVLLNRKVEALGTKSSGEWTLEVYLELGN